MGSTTAARSSASSPTPTPTSTASPPSGSTDLPHRPAGKPPASAARGLRRAWCIIGADWAARRVLMLQQRVARLTGVAITIALLVSVMATGVVGCGATAGEEGVVTIDVQHPGAALP